MNERKRPVLKATQGLVGLLAMGYTGKDILGGFGKLGSEVLVKTGLMTKGIIPDFLTSIDHSTFTFLDGLPLGFRVAATVGMTLSTLALSTGGFLLASDAYRHLRSLKNR